MKKNLPELIFILDRSGSMAGLEKDTVGGYNAFLERQKEAPGEALVSTVLFSNESAVIHDRVPLAKMEPMTLRQYQVYGCTALMDAIGDAIRHIATIHKYARAEDVPEHTVFVIITDGMENASSRYSSDEVKAMITRKKAEYGWEFLFLAANIDAVETAGSIGIGADRSANYMADACGTAETYRAVHRAVRDIRSSAPLSADWKSSVEDDHKKRSGKN